MPPPPARLASQQNKQTSVVTFPKGIVTRSKRTTLAVEGENQHNGGKRKADSPLKAKVTKRSAFGDITNAIGKSANDTKKVLKNVANTHGKSLAVFKDKKPVEKKEALPKPAPRLTLQSQSNHLQPTTRKTATATASLLVQSTSEATSKTKSKEPVPSVKAPVPKEAPSRASLRLSSRLSLDNDSGESSLYVSALEDISDNALDLATPSAEEKVTENAEVSTLKPFSCLPPGVNDFDAENIKDVHSVSDFAMDIFTYLKERESEFIIDDYMERQFHLSRWMRSLLVDWMVEVQENFELNHETLYLAVKVVDLYLSKVIITKEKLQLVGAAAVFIASKFDERVPPLVDDLIYICDGAYSHQELIRMETAVLTVIDFDLGIPLSYRFLRRYARCAGIAMPQLTLARYILEMALMEYSLISLSDSKLAAAALLLALRMQNLGGWTPTLEYYSGYKVEDIKSICYDLNEMLHKKPKAALATVRNKYSHKVFFEVATLPLLDDMDLNI